MVLLEDRLKSGLSTVQAWHSNDDNDNVGNDIRHVVLNEWMLNDDDDNDNNDEEDNWFGWEGNDLWLWKLCQYFPKHVMTWMNQPSCIHCGNNNNNNMNLMNIRGPESIEEIEGKAHRVEVYQCLSCSTTTSTTFPRYNCAKYLWKLYRSNSTGKARGRCGEYANLFGYICYELGYDVRYILDCTDHVWVEIWSDRQQQWIMADACEGQIQLNGMYEQGWGKQLNYILAFTPTTIVDVTQRYTRQFHTKEFQQRRRTICPSESYSQQLIATYNHTLSSTTTTNNNNNNDNMRLLQLEQDYFHSITTTTTTSNVGLSWQPHEYNTGGRISGSYAWKASRHELGTTTTNDNNNSKNDKKEEDGNELYYHVEQFWPVSIVSKNLLMLKVSCERGADCIQVGGISCGIGLNHTVSIVTVDETNGCILTSRSFAQWNHAAYQHIHSIPNHRILLLSSTNTTTPSTSSPPKQVLSRLGGFTLPTTTTNTNNVNVLYIGQVNHYPSWATTVTWMDNDNDETTTTTTTTTTAAASQKKSIHVSLSLKDNDVDTTNKDKSQSRQPQQLQVYKDTVPNYVSSRLPESIMPLATQLIATPYQKQQAFDTYLQQQQQQPSTTVVGYTTQSNCPIYLLSSPKSYPFCQTKFDTSDWNTYLSLPSPLITNPTTTTTDTTKKSSSSIPKYDIPIDESVWTSLLGPTLVRSGSNGNNMATVDALKQTKLVALYFSAHWCPPCRQFTPMLIQFYNHLQQQQQQQKTSLEIIFISSDRDTSSFQHYFSTMPWYSLPTTTSNNSTEMMNSHFAVLKQRLGIQGIPALVVLDTMSGEIVVPKETARTQVMTACRRGGTAMETLVQDVWMSQLPEDTQMILQTLELSCQDNNNNNDNDNNNPQQQQEIIIHQRRNRYLIRDIPTNEQQSPSQNNNNNHNKDPAVRIKEIFTELVAQGMEPNAAAAKAIQSLSSSDNNNNNNNNNDDDEPKKKLGSGTLEGTVQIMTKEEEKEEEKVVVLTKEVMQVAYKYLKNVMKHPNNPKFRRFKLSNKIFDRIVSIDGGLDQLIHIGFQIYPTDTDFYATIPLNTNLTQMNHLMTSILHPK